LPDGKRIAAIWKDKDEFVTTEAVDSRATLRDCGQALGDLLKQLVTGE